MCNLECTDNIAKAPVLLLLDILGCAFPRNSPGISQGLQEIDFDIWGIWAFPVHSPGTNIKRSTDGKGTSKNVFCFHMEQVFALLLLASA
jgi:hypothetical protein